MDGIGQEYLWEWVGMVKLSGGVSEIDQECLRKWVGLVKSVYGSGWNWSSVYGFGWD